jgi:hypothetical protein
MDIGELHGVETAAADAVVQGPGGAAATGATTAALVEMAKSFASLTSALAAAQQPSQAVAPVLMAYQPPQYEQFDSTTAAGKQAFADFRKAMQAYAGSVGPRRPLHVFISDAAGRAMLGIADASLAEKSGGLRSLSDDEVIALLDQVAQALRGRPQVTGEVPLWTGKPSASGVGEAGLVAFASLISQLERTYTPTAADLDATDAPILTALLQSFGGHKVTQSIKAWFSRDEKAAGRVPVLTYKSLCAFIREQYRVGETFIPRMSVFYATRDAGTLRAGKAAAVSAAPEVPEPAASIAAVDARSTWASRARGHPGGADGGMPGPQAARAKSWGRGGGGHKRGRGGRGRGGGGGGTPAVTFSGSKRSAPEPAHAKETSGEGKGSIPKKPRTE